MANSTEEGVVGGNQDSAFINDFITLQWVLQQFQNGMVRQAFLEGNIIPGATVDMLTRLDWLSQLISPNYSRMQLASALLSDRINEITSIIRGDDSPWHTYTDADGTPETYKTCKVWWKTIAQCSYWTTYNIKPTFSSTPRTIATSFKSLKLSGDDSDPPKTNKIKLNNNELKYRQHIDLTDSSDAPSILSSGEDSSELSECSKPRRKYLGRPNRAQVNRLDDSFVLTQREVVKPIIFQMNGYQSLQRFFASYENYFKQKYNGTARECTQELANFLPTEMLNVYEILGGANIKYKQMKSELVKWYSSQKKSTRFWKKELINSKMEENETLCLYGMRLKRLAEKAYPQSITESHRELRHQYCKTVPAGFKYKMENLEDLREQLGQSRRLSWPERMKLAEKEDRRNNAGQKSLQVEEPRPVFYNSQRSGITNALNTTNKTKTYRNSNMSARTNGNNDKYNQHYYNKINNTPITREQQPTSQPRFKSRERQQFRGNCNWCGKLGHTEYNCWIKSGACVICGSVEHELTTCPANKFNRSREPKFPICSICGGNHLGKDCYAKRARSHEDEPAAAQSNTNEPLNSIALITGE